MITIPIALYTSVILLLIIGLVRILLKTNVTHKTTSTNIGISVVVAFRNEEKNLPLLIQSLKKQLLPQDQWEVIFVDDGSSDNGPEAISQQGQFFHLIRMGNHTGKKQAIIRGISAAKFNLIALTDADCIPEPTWLQCMLASSGDNALIQGTVNIKANTIAEYFEALDYASLMATSAGSFGIKRPVIASAANMALRKDLISVSDSTLKTSYASGDDMFLLHTAKRQNLPIKFIIDPNADVTTHFEGGFVQMLQRRKRWASKSSGYSDFDTIAVAIIVLLLNLSIVIQFCLAILGAQPWTNALILWAAKSLMDLVLLLIFLQKKGFLKLLLLYLPLQLIYPFYLTFAAFSGLLTPTRWK